MRICEIKKISVNLFSGRYGESFVVVFACIAMYLLFTLPKIAVTICLLNNNTLLFGRDSLLWLLFELLTGLLKFIIMTPVISGAVWWFAQAASGEHNHKDSIIKMYTSFKFNARAAMVFMIIWVIKLLTVSLPCLCIYGIYIVINLGFEYTNGGLFLMIAVNLAVTFVLTAILYINIAIGLSIAPFLYVKNPFLNPLKLIHHSFKIMAGQRFNFVRLILSYWYMIPLMCLIVPIPFVLPKILMSAAVFYNDCIFEYNQKMSYDECINKKRFARV